MGRIRLAHAAGGAGDDDDLAREHGWTACHYGLFPGHEGPAWAAAPLLVV